MIQTRTASFIEATFNTAIGFVFSFMFWPIAATVAGVEYTGGQHFAMTGMFTAISVLRTYLVRRHFNSRIHLAAVSVASAMSDQEPATDPAERADQKTKTAGHTNQKPASL